MVWYGRREVLDVLARNAREDIDDIAAQTGLDAAAAVADRRAGGG